MTDRRVKARELKDQGLSNAEIARRLGVTPSAITKWLNPEKTQEWNRIQNAKRHQAKLRWQNEKDRSPEGRGECQSCGQLKGIGMGRHGVTGICIYCIGAEHDRKGTEYERLWAEGKKFREIQKEMDWSPGMVRKMLDEYRGQGYNLPYRYKPGKRNARKYPEQVAA